MDNQHVFLIWIKYQRTQLGRTQKHNGGIGWIKFFLQGQGVVTGVFVIPLFSVNVAKPKSKLGKALAEAGKKILENAKLRCAKNGILFYEKILCGNEGFKLVSFAKNKKADLIVMGSRGQSNVKEFILGSVSHYVVHKSPIPVLIVK
jgi:nucleotide-binding universal stress UspA family protein